MDSHNPKKLAVSTADLFAPTNSTNLSHSDPSWTTWPSHRRVRFSLIGTTSKPHGCGYGRRRRGCPKLSPSECTPSPADLDLRTRGRSLPYTRHRSTLLDSPNYLTSPGSSLRRSTIASFSSTLSFARNTSSLTPERSSLFLKNANTNRVIGNVDPPKY